MPANSAHSDHDANLATWLRARDVIAGEDAVKLGGIKYLPRLDSQTDITSRLTFIETLASTFTEKRRGQNNHHSVTTFEFEIKRHVNLDISYNWDYL